MRKKLTKRTIDAAKYERKTGAHYIWDTETPAFALRVYPSGRKSFAVSYRVRGKQRFYTLGRYGEMTLHQARKKAQAVLAQAREGLDVAGERMAYHRSPTIAELAKRHIEEHSRINRKPAGAEADERMWERLVLPRLGHRKVSDITRADVQELHTALADTPVMANHVRKLLSKAFNLAEIWGLRPDGSNPCRHVKPYKRQKHERYLSPEELARLSELLAFAERTRAESLYVVASIRLLILTGCRVMEILKLRWQDVDFKAGCLRLPDSKTGPKVVYLNAPALELLLGLPRVDGNEHVIPGKKAGSHLQSLRNPWNRIRKQAAIEDVRIHDLRHSFASFGVGLGLSLPVVGKLLGHAVMTTTERYAHLADDPVRAANERIGAHIAALMSGQSEVEALQPWPNSP